MINWMKKFKCVCNFENAVEQEFIYGNEINQGF